MKLVRQRRKDDCLSCVAAMAFNVTPELYEEYASCRNLDSTQDQTFVKFAFDVGYLVGAYFAKPLKFDCVEELVNVNLEPSLLALGVESECPKLKAEGISHAILYEGGLFYDPALNEPHDDISKYTILSFIPLARLEDHKRWK